MPAVAWAWHGEVCVWDGDLEGGRAEGGKGAEHLALLLGLNIVVVQRRLAR